MPVSPRVLDEGPRDSLEVDAFFAAAFASAMLGILMVVVVSFVQNFTLRHWHESAVAREA